MWKAAAGQSVKVALDEEVDDWETDPDFEVIPRHLRSPYTLPIPRPCLTAASLP